MRVLISGGGIAGPSMAWFLAKAGARVTVLEKAPDLLAQGQNIDIQGSARTVVRKMGLYDKILENNTTEAGSEVVDTNGRAFASFPIKKGFDASLTSDFEILRADLARVFYDATVDHPKVDYKFGTIVEEVLRNDEEAVKVQLSDGTVQDYDVLVAADGQWSKLRKQLFPPESITVIDKNMYCVYGTIRRLATDKPWWSIYVALRSRIVTLRPDPHGTIRAMFTIVPRNEAQRQAWLAASRSDRETQAKLVRSEFADAGWQAKRLLDALEESPDLYFQNIQQVKMQKWWTGRVICLGDAAYAPSPLTGMGTSLAITGGYVLAGELSKLKDGEHPERAFEEYDKLFRPFVEDRQHIPSFIPGYAHPETAFQRWLLETFMWSLAKVAKVIFSMPWLEKRLGASTEDDYKLPLYPVFEGDATRGPVLDGRKRSNSS